MLVEMNENEYRVLKKVLNEAMLDEGDVIPNFPPKWHSGWQGGGPEPKPYTGPTTKPYTQAKLNTIAAEISHYINGSDFKVADVKNNPTNNRRANVYLADANSDTYNGFEYILVIDSNFNVFSILNKSKKEVYTKRSGFNRSVLDEQEIDSLFELLSNEPFNNF